MDDYIITKLLTAIVNVVVYCSVFSNVFTNLKLFNSHLINKVIILYSLKLLTTKGFCDFKAPTGNNFILENLLIHNYVCRG